MQGAFIGLNFVMGLFYQCATGWAAEHICEIDASQPEAPGSNLNASQTSLICYSPGMPLISKMCNLNYLCKDLILFTVQQESLK